MSRTPLLLLLVAATACSVIAPASAQVKKMDNLPAPSGPKKTIEVNPWGPSKKAPAPIQAQCGDAIVFTWTPSGNHGLFRPAAGPGKNGTCVCPRPAGNGTAGEGLMLAPLSMGGSYRYVVINESRPFCLTSQAPGDCALKNMQQVVVPSCPQAPPAASSARALAAAAAGSLGAVLLGALAMVV